jgi:hypothetical protein
MVEMSEISKLKVASISKGKTKKPYVNLKSNKSFYIVKGSEIYKITFSMTKLINKIKDIVMLNGADDTEVHLKMNDNNVCMVVTNIGVIVMDINTKKNIVYFSKPDDVEIYC